MNAIRKPNPAIAEAIANRRAENEASFTIERFASSTRLPTLPEVAERLVEVASDDDPDYAKISQIIRSDPVISGKILKTVNSALFGFRQSIETVEEALPKLGLSMLRTLILSFHLSRTQSDEKSLALVLQNQWRSSLTQAVLAELIAEQLEGADEATYFLAGMMQDIGLLAMISEAPDAYVKNVLDRVCLPNVVAAERDYFGFCHVDVTIRILEKWGMSDCFGNALRHHHDRVVPVGGTANRRLAVVLQAANQGAEIILVHQEQGTPLATAIHEWASFLKMQMAFSEQQTESLIEEVNVRVNEYSAMFSFNIGSPVGNDRVIEAAKDMLQEIALENQLSLMAAVKTPHRRADDDELYRDSLSGLNNRRFLNEKLPEVFQAAIKSRKPVAFLFLDVDKFKSINDSLGHAAGDKAIQHVADWLAKSIRKQDLAIRLGGDEFLLVLNKLKHSDFENIAGRIAGDIPPFQLDDGSTLKIELSIGGAFYQPKKGDSPDPNWLIDQADQLMYRAKREANQSLATATFTGQSR